jgi:flagellar hook-associated protein 3 FlgL
MTIVSTSAFYERATTDINTLRKRADQLQSQISSGQRLTRSSDDPVAAARLRVLSRADGLSQVNVTNANRATSDLTLADNALQDIADNVTKAKELATQAANGTLSTEQRASIGQQIASIRQNLIALANSKDSSGNALFGGEGAGDAYTLDGSGNPVYAGTASAGELPLGDGQSVTRGVTGPEVFNFTVNGSPTDLFAVLGNLAAALQGSSSDPQGAANDALTALGSGLEKVTTNQTVVGARMNWVDANLDRHTKQGEVRATEENDIGGIDAASAVTQMQQIMTVLEASQASFVKLASMSLFDMMR